MISLNFWKILENDMEINKISGTIETRIIRKIIPLYAAPLPRHCVAAQISQNCAISTQNVHNFEEIIVSTQTSKLWVVIWIFFFCSFDLRNKHPSQGAKPWSSPTVFKNRATFLPKTQPAFLIIDSITPEDETVYRCRVDFQNSPTRNSKVNLTVIGKFQSFFFSRLSSINFWVWRERPLSQTGQIRDVLIDPGRDQGEFVCSRSWWNTPQRSEGCNICRNYVISLLN